MTNARVLGIIFSLGMVQASAQVSIDVPGYRLQIPSSSGSSAQVNSEYIDADAQIEGVTIINAKVFIDGEEIKNRQRIVVSKKTKKKYLIHWGSDGNVSVEEK